MRVSNWNPQKFDGEFSGVCMERLREAAEVVASAARSKCPVGTISRPIYKRGPYAGKYWTARDAGALKKTIRVVEKKGIPPGFAFGSVRNIRIYAGNKKTFYASIVEFGGRHFMRPAFNQSKAQIRSILGAR